MAEPMTPQERLKAQILATAQAKAATEAEASGGGFMRTVDDVMRGAADTSSFGFSDEIAAGLGAATGIGGEQGNYDANVAAERERDAEGGWPRFAGQVAGAFLNPASAARSVLGAAAQGAGLGGLYGLGSGEGGIVERLPTAAAGAGLGGAGGAIVQKGVNAFANSAARKSIPTVPDLKSRAKAGYDAADAAGVIVKPQGTQQLAATMKDELVEFGFDPILHPRVAQTLNRAEQLAGENVTFKGLGVLRKVAASAAKSTDASEAALGTQLVKRIEGYMENLPADDVLTGNASQASKGFREGQDNWARYRRAEMLDTAKLKAERRASSSGTGGNLENTMRQNTRAILDNPRRSRGMTGAEIEQAEKVVRGTAGQNALRLAGRMSPTSGALPAMANIAATAYDPTLLALGVAGLGAKAGAEAITKQNFAKLSEIVRSGGKETADIVNDALQGKGSPEVIAAVQNILQRGFLGRKVGAMVPATAAPDLVGNY